MGINLKYKLLRILNIGVLGVDEFYDKKKLQLYNTFLLFGTINITIYGILLLIYGYYINLFFYFLCLSVIVFCFMLNNFGYVRLSKIVLMQFFITVTLLMLMIFSYNTLFTLYFFISILYATLLFNVNELYEKIFFIVEGFIMFFITLSPIKNYLPSSNLLDQANIADINFISIIVFVLFLYSYIYFHTTYQKYTQSRYEAMTKRYFKNYLKVRHDNIKKKLIVSITSNLLIEYLEKYQILFDLYLYELDGKEKNKEKNMGNIGTYYNNLNTLNKNIEELLNYQFSKSNSESTLRLNSHEIHDLTAKIINEKNLKLQLSKHGKITMTIHEDLYSSFLQELMKRFNDCKYTIKLSMRQKEKPITITDRNTRIIDVLGIQTNYRFENNNMLFITMYFFNNPDQTTIYYV